MIAIPFNAAGLDVFPCAIHFDKNKNKWQKKPITVNRESWAETAKRPLSDPAVQWGGITVVGIPIPGGVVILDGDWYKDGTSRQAAEAVFGCSLPWDEALIQKTIGGGEHYAFRLPDWPVRQGSNFNGSGVDTRTAGKGFICSGEGYTPAGMGCFRLAYPESLPMLPDGCRETFEHVVSETTPTPAPLLGLDEHAAVIEQALGFVSPDVSHDEWIRTGMALRHHFEADPELGFALFDRWSYGDLLPNKECPASYIPEESHAQYWALKPSRHDGQDIKAATIFYKAVQGGWVPPLTLDTSAAFGVATADASTFERLLNRINESGTDPLQTAAIIDEIKAANCDELQVALLSSSLRSALKEAKLWSKETSKSFDNKIAECGSSQTLVPPTVLPDVVDIKELASRSISQPSGVHGENAAMMQREVFGGRLLERLGMLWWWSGREWQPIPEKTLKRITYDALRPGFDKDQNVMATIKALHAKTDDLPDPIRGPFISFKDCVLNAATRETREHKSSDNNTSTLTVNFSQKASNAPNWFTFLAQVFGGLDDGNERVSLLQEIMGWAMLQDDLNIQKIVALDGASRGGKSVILEILQEILGEAKSGVTTFSNLDNGKTQSAFRLHDVMVDLDAKPPNRQDIKAAIGFLNKVASNEKVSIQLLNTQQPWTGRLNSKLLIASNGIPTLMDDSGATTNRFLVLYFSRSFAGHEDKGILNRLKTETQSIAAWATEGAIRIANNGGQFTRPRSSVEAITDMREHNQPLEAFITEYLEFDGAARCFSKDIWATYRLFASESNMKLGTKSAFSRSIKSALLGKECEYQRVIRIGGEVSSGYAGFKVRSLIVGESANTAGAFKPEIVK